MDDGRLTTAIHRFDGDPLVIHPCHSANLERSMCPGIHLGKMPVALKNELAGLEVE